MVSIVTSLFIVCMLQFLSYFQFIDWKPISLLRSTVGKVTEQQVILFSLLVLGFFLYFLLCTILIYYLSMIPPYLMSLLLAILSFFLAEWVLSGRFELISLITLKSVPFLAIFAIVFRMIAGTTIYYKEQLESDG